jgi:ABC-2 type transport system ATP-binding protein
MTGRAPASLRIERLSHRYPGADRHALADVALSVAPGERLGLLGPNGAGKSTLMRIVCGFLPVQPQRVGPPPVVEVAGLDVQTRALAVRKNVGYMPELVPLYTELRAVEHLRFRARLKGVPRRDRSREIHRVAELVGIEDVLMMPIGKLSRGYRQRVGLADALLGAPPLLVLDEPTVGLDPNQVRDVRQMLREIGGGQTLVFSSHILPEVEALCDRVVILSHGRTVLDAPLAEALVAGEVVFEAAIDDAHARSLAGDAWAAVGLSGTPELELARTKGIARVRIALPASDAARMDELCAAIGTVSLDRRVALVGLVPGRTRLEERFAAVTGGRADDA